MIEASGGLTRWYVDTGPVLEKAWAVAAGLGFIGRNGLLISPTFGSFVFLGVVLTDLDVAPAMTASDRHDASRHPCGDCRACVEACPTGALSTPFEPDIGRCLAHWTVTARTPIPPDIAARLEGNLYGCEVCQDVCPYNLTTHRIDRPDFRPLPGLRSQVLSEVLAMDETAFRERFGSTPVRRMGVERLKRNARMLVR
jgi:epoxyqueuosine reductase